MVLNLDNAGTVFTILGGIVAVLAGLFAGLRYIIRAETSELRANGGSSLKDAVNRIESLSLNTKAALEQHVADSKVLIEQGTRDKDRIEGTIATLAEAVKIAAASTPPGEN